MSENNNDTTWWTVTLEEDTSWTFWLDEEPPEHRKWRIFIRSAPKEAEGAIPLEEVPARAAELKKKYRDMFPDEGAS